MKTIRNIIQIDEERCNGCGHCVTSCAEGAIAIIDGKAKIIADLYCDGLGACIGTCPTDALTIIQREADPFSEEAVHKLLQNRSSCPSVQPAPQPLGGHLSGGAATLGMAPIATPHGLTGPASRNWPVKLRLTSPDNAVFKGKTLIVAADCSAFASPRFHQEVPADTPMVIFCPKFENHGEVVEKLASLLQQAKPQRCIAVRMEVPCCNGILSYALESAVASGTHVPVVEVVVTRNGDLWTGGQQGIAHLFSGADSAD